MKRIPNLLAGVWRNKWGRRLTGTALVWLTLEIVATGVVLAGFAWAR
jgi:hypothetical protein